MKYNAPYKFKIPEGMIAIYYLYDPKYPSEIRYIGQTKQQLPNRMSNHISETFRNNRGGWYKCDWIRKVINKNRHPNIALLDIVPEDIWEETEKYYIKLMRDLGHKLVNLTKGGDAGNPIGYIHTPEMRKSRAEWMKGNKNANGKKTQEHIRKISLARLGKGKAVLMLNPETNEVLKKFPTLREAGKVFNSDHSAIWRVCNNKIKKAYGYKWCYA